MKKSNIKIIIFYVVLIAVVIIVVASMLSRLSQPQSVIYSQIVDLFEKEQVKSFEVKADGTLTIKTTDDKKVEFKLQDVSLFYSDFHDKYFQQYKDGKIESFNFAEPDNSMWWLSLLPYVVPVILIVLLWIFVIKQTSGGMSKINSFGKIRTKAVNEDNRKVTFKDVAGADVEKNELQEIVEFLKDPAKFTKLGAKIPHGVLLVGPPGTGKTLLAKAVAGEAGVPFFAISGSDFVEMYVGVGASRVRDLFDTAKKHPASIIFIDEIDAVGRHRGAGLGGGHDEREQTLNQLLVEMDGFGTNDGVIVMAATNRSDILDPALLRPGRFDRKVVVSYPDINGREEILKVHSKNKPLGKDVDLRTIAKSTIGFTGADLANLLNEAALLAAKRNKSLIGMDEIEDATIKVIVGPQKKGKQVSEKDKKITAYHEAGHAILTYAIEGNSKVHQISIVPAGYAGGYTMSLPKDDISLETKSDMQNSIVTLLGGRVAEAIIFGDITTGASNDIQRVTSIARNMVMKFGMSSVLGPIVYGSGHSDDEVFLGRDFSSSKNYSEETASKIDEEIKLIVTKAYETAEKTLNEHMDKLHFVAAFLEKNEIMDEEQFKAAMEGNPTVEELEEMAKAAKKKAAEENKAEEERIAAEKAEQERKEAEKAEQERKEAERAADDSEENEE